MKYNYDAKNECFVRADGLGKKFFINSHEAQRIMTMVDLGYSIPRICNKIQFASDKVYESTVANFINNVKEGNIIVSDEYPAPEHTIRELTVEDRISRLEERIGSLEELANDKISETEKSFTKRWRKWLKS